MTTRRRPTMADVAERAKVSLSTVSLTYSGAGPISNETKARVQKAAKALGYAGPSPLGKSLRSGRTGVVAVVVASKLVNTFRDPTTLRVMDGLVDHLGTMGLGVLLAPPPTGEDGETSLLDTAAVDAAVVMRVSDHDDPALAILSRRGIPVVIMEAPPIKGAGLVTIDDAAGTAQLIRSLVDLGHTRIGTVTLPFGPTPATQILDPKNLPPISWTPTRNRLAAFAHAGVEPCVVVEAAASMVEEGIAAGHLAISDPSKPTAIVCQSDLLAGGVIIAARELELRVPQDLSVTGFDGVDLPWLSPHELTTMTQDGVAKGQALAREVKALLDGESPAPVTVPLAFRAGTTTARPN